MALSPWPTSPAALRDATATLKASLGADLDDARVQALGCAAAALVERYAAGAPQAIKDEAVTRTGGLPRRAAGAGALLRTGGRRVEAPRHDARFGLAPQWQHGVAQSLEGETRRDDRMRLAPRQLRDRVTWRRVRLTSNEFGESVRAITDTEVAASVQPLKLTDG